MTAIRQTGEWGTQVLESAAKALAIVLLLLVTSITVSAQINSPVGPISLAANMPSSITIAVTPGLVTFNLPRIGVAAGSSPITITTTYTLAANAQVSIYAYFSNPASAMSNAGGQKIPAANVSASVNGGAFTPFTGASPYAASSSITIYSRLRRGGRPPRTRTDTLNLDISTIGLVLGPGGYAGVLLIQAQAI